MDLLERREVVTDKGELLGVWERVERTVRGSEEPDYVKLYLKAWCDFKMADVGKREIAVLYGLLPYMSWANEQQIVFVNSAMKEIVAGQISSTRASVDNAISKLAKSGVLKRVGRGAYAVNPELVGRGSWRDVKRLRATFGVIGEGQGSVVVESDLGE